MIEVDGVGVTYPPAVEALRDCTLRVEEGDFVTITGPSGSGKSTLLNVLGLLDRATAGTYRLDGQLVDGMGEAELAQLRATKIGFVFQSFHLIRHRNVLQNIELGGLYRMRDRQGRAQRARVCAERVGLGHRLHARTATLSGGESQRVAMARALMGSPALLLCDEPTGNLDSANTAAILGLLSELNDDGTTIIVITHEPDVAAQGRRRLNIQDGIVSELTSAQ